MPPPSARGAATTMSLACWLCVGLAADKDEVRYAQRNDEQRNWCLLRS